MLELLTIVYAKPTLLNNMTKDSVDTIKLSGGLKDTFKKRQETMVQRFDVFDTTITIINAHLTSGKECFADRSEDVKRIFEEAFQKDKFGMVQEDIIHKSDHIFMFGSLNFRLGGDDYWVRNIASGMDSRNDSEWTEEELNKFDQLLAVDEFVTFGPQDWYLKDFKEAKITFGPTCKYDTNTQRFNTDSKHVCSW